MKVTALLVLVVMSLLAGCQKRYAATTTVQFKLDGAARNSTPVATEEAEKVLVSLVPSEMQPVSIKPIRNTELFQIVATDPDPKAAMSRANKVAEEIRRTASSKYPQTKLIIWEYAELPR